jgi:hypothetical protein
MVRHGHYTCRAPLARGTAFVSEMLPGNAFERARAKSGAPVQQG